MFKSSEKTREIIDQMISDIIRKMNPEKVILFGSFARGAETDDSDVDLCIIADTDLSGPRRTAHARAILEQYRISKDIIVKTPREYGRYRDIVNSIDYEIEHFGKVLYER